MNRSKENLNGSDYYYYESFIRVLTEIISNYSHLYEKYWGIVYKKWKYGIWQKIFQK